MQRWFYIRKPSLRRRLSKNGEKRKRVWSDAKCANVVLCNAAHTTTQETLWNHWKSERESTNWLDSLGPIRELKWDQLERVAERVGFMFMFFYWNEPFTTHTHTRSHSSVNYLLLDIFAQWLKNAFLMNWARIFKSWKNRQHKLLAESCKQKGYGKKTFRWEQYCWKWYSKNKQLIHNALGLQSSMLQSRWSH